MKSFNTVLIEAIVVGALLIVVYIVVDFVLKNLFKTINIHPYITLFVSGALFHLLCEYTGINIWYVREYNKILQ